MPIIIYFINLFHLVSPIFHISFLLFRLFLGDVPGLRLEHMGFSCGGAQAPGPQEAQ